MATRQRLNTSDKVTMRDFLQFQNEIDDVVTRDLNRSEDKIALAMERSENRFNKTLEAMEARTKADREASEARLKADREEFSLRFAEERNEWRSHKRWLYLNFGGLIALIITVILALMNGNIPS